MRKRLAALLATIMLLTLTAAAPGVAQDGEELITVCLTDSVTIEQEEVGPGTVEIELRFAIQISLLAPEIITEGPCPDSGGGGGGGGDGGGGGGAAAAPLELSQETEQEAESGDVDQSFDVSQTGDNSNQCASVQGVT